MSMASFPFLFASNVVLFLLLRYHETFIYNSNIIMDKELTEDFILIFLFPLGGLLLASNLAYLVVIASKYDESNFYYGATYITSLFTASLKMKVKKCIRLLTVLLILIGVFTMIGITAMFLNPHLGKK